jgi:hypothetical protein
LTVFLEKRLLLLLLLVAAMAALLAACGDDDDGDSDEPSVTASTDASGERTEDASSTPVDTGDAPAECTADDAVRGLLARLELSGDDGIFEPGEEIDFTFRLIINCGDNESTLYYPTSQRYHFFVDSPSNEQVWSSADEQVFEQVQGTEVIEIHETLQYEETWDQTDRDGEQVPDGVYKVSAFSVGCAQETQSNCQFGSVSQFEIRSGTQAPPETDEATPEPTS